MDYMEEALKKHYEWRGKIEISPKAHAGSKEELSLCYTPGVARPCLEIAADESLSYELTGRGNLVAVITDGTAVLGLGDIGPAASMPVMEGKCVLFKEFAGVDAFPICIDTKDPDEFVRTVELLQYSFGGINLEDISAPRCFEIERKLKERLQIPVFHDDQHGTAIVAGAALINALKVVGKDIRTATVVMSGAGAAGIAIARFLLSLGAGNIIMCDKNGILCRGDESLNSAQKEISQVTNAGCMKGTLAQAMKGADVFIGVSAPGIVTEDMVASMNDGAIVFPMANPTPEIDPLAALRAGARIVGTGRSDYPNQINNVLAFPGIFKGALAVRASDITEGMKLAAAKAIASSVPNPDENNIIPKAFDRGVADKVAAAVAGAARAEGIARIG